MSEQSDRVDTEYLRRLALGKEVQGREDVSRQLDRTADELDALREIVDRLPKDGNGKPIGPNMMVWHWFEVPPGWVQIKVLDILGGGQLYCCIEGGESDGWEDVREASECYVTKPEAAEKAREGGDA